MQQLLKATWSFQAALILGPFGGTERILYERTRTRESSTVPARSSVGERAKATLPDLMGRMASKYGGSHKPMRNFFELDAQQDQAKHGSTGDWWRPYLHVDAHTQVLLRPWSMGGAEAGTALALLAAIAGLCFAERVAAHAAARSSEGGPRYRAAMHALKMVRAHHRLLFRECQTVAHGPVLSPRPTPTAGSELLMCGATLHWCCPQALHFLVTLVVVSFNAILLVVVVVSLGLGEYACLRLYRDDGGYEQCQQHKLKKTPPMSLV